MRIDPANPRIRSFMALLSGGTAGQKYVLTNHITTAGGRQMDQSVKLPVKDK